MNVVRAFGPRAQAYAASLKAAVPTLVFEAQGASAALRCAVDLKKKQGGFDLITIYDEPRVTVAQFMAQHVATTFASYDERRLALDTLARNELVANGQPQRSYADVDAAILLTMRDVASLANRWIVRSWTEYHRLAARFEHEPAIVERVLSPHPIPAVSSRTPCDGSIVVWAPGIAIANLFIVTMALLEARRAVFVVTDVDEVAVERLKSAALVVAASTDNPAAAVALAACGIPVIAASTSGIAEYLDIGVYEPWSRRSVLDTVLCGLAARPMSKVPACAEVPAAHNAVAHAGAAPLVSLIVRTANRERLLERALQSVAEQRYKAVEAIVVNNGGRDISAICGAHDFTVPVNIEASPIWRAANAGLKAARGEYVALLDDDDAIFPDHLELLVGALERSGAVAAYSDSINVYIAVREGEYAVTGYTVVCVPAVIPSVMLSRCQLVGSSRVLFRKSALGEEVFSENLAVAGDYELWLRLNRRFDFVRVNAVTSLYSQFEDHSNVSLHRGHRYLDAHRAIYAFHPVEGRPKILEERAQVLRFLEAQGGLGMTPPAMPFREPFPLD